jgi:hypothetical protein
LTTSPSNPTIYYITARVAAKRKQHVSERVMWLVSVFDTPHEIMAHDTLTMSRLQKTFCTSRAKTPCHVIVREVLNAKPVGVSQLTIDEHRSKHT